MDAGRHPDRTELASAQGLWHSARLARPIELHRCATTRDFKTLAGTADATRAARRRRYRDRPHAEDDGRPRAGFRLAGEACSAGAWRRHPAGYHGKGGRTRLRRDPEP